MVYLLIFEKLETMKRSLVTTISEYRRQYTVAKPVFYKTCDKFCLSNVIKYWKVKWCVGSDRFQSRDVTVMCTIFYDYIDHKNVLKNNKRQSNRLWDAKNEICVNVKAI